MRRSFGWALLGTFMALAVATDASAQVGVYLGPGATFPISTYGDYAKTGWMMIGGVGVPVGDQGLIVGAEGFYGSNSHSDVDGDKTNLYGVMGQVNLLIGEPDAVAPFVFVGLGYLTHSYKSDVSPEGSTSALAAEGGAGVQIPFNETMSGFIGAAVMSGFGDLKDTRFVGVAAGLQFILGGGGM